MRCKACDRDLKDENKDPLAELCNRCYEPIRPYKNIDELVDTKQLVKDGFWRYDQETYDETKDPCSFSFNERKYGHSLRSLQGEEDDSDYCEDEGELN